MFDIYKYIDFVKQHITVIHTRKGSFTEQQVIDFCCQWELSADKFFGSTDVRKKLRRIFKDSILNKPNSVEINTYLLYLFGYIRCYKCANNKPLDSFNKNISTYNGYNKYCKHCHIGIQQEYRNNNRDVVRAGKARRRAAELNATPSWLTEEQHKAILTIYATALRENKVVDHIVPLQGKTVCGLHVPWNLQVLDSTANASKGNKLILPKEELFDENTVS